MAGSDRPATGGNEPCRLNWTELQLISPRRRSHEKPDSVFSTVFFRRYIFSVPISMKTFVLVLSLVANFVLVGALGLSALEGCAEVADGRIGVLTRGVEVGSFRSGQFYFKLPAGIVVRDASATGADWFEPHRFRIVVTSDDESLVDYSQDITIPEDQDSEYYSAEDNSTE